MATTTRIEWADATTNTAVGCSHCSPGCDHCYAEKFAHRLSKHPVAAKVYAGVVDERGKRTGKINSNFSEKMYPHRVPGKGKRVFVGSMTDIFHPNYPAENRDELFASIMADYIFANGHGHTFIILTKRPQAMAEYFAAGPNTLLRRWGRAGNGWIIVGDGDSEICPECGEDGGSGEIEEVCPGCGSFMVREHPDTQYVDWVICGGETGQGARPMNPDWVRSLRDQCQEATVPFFFKSWGEWAPDCLCGTKKPHPETPRPAPGHMGCMFKCGKANSGRSIDKRTWDEVPQ